MSTIRHSARVHKQASEQLCLSVCLCDAQQITAETKMPKLHKYRQRWVAPKMCQRERKDNTV